MSVVVHPEAGPRLLQLPGDHPRRFDLSNEVHARPPEPVTAPTRLTCLALMTPWPYRESDREPAIALARQYGVTPPGPGVKHYSVDVKDFRLVWERHTEFTRYTFYARGLDGDDPFARTAIEAAPRRWVADLPGETMAATHAALMPDAPEGDDYARVAERFFSGNALIGSKITGGAAVALTDFRIHADGFSRFLIQNRSMSPWHAGRIVQRLLEIETYRIVALLALPVAQSLSPRLAESEAELALITKEMMTPEFSDEPMLLERLTRLQAAIEQGQTESQFRFGAANAYYALVQRRIEELREERLTGMQTFEEFTDRRLAPAMSTCAAVATRTAALSDRLDRAAQLLSTRVNMSLERQNQALLNSMNRRAKLQLRLQETVEGLSVAAITYYVVGVLGYLAKGAEAAHWGPKADLVTGAAVPLVAAALAFGLWRTRKRLHKRGKSGSEEDAT